MKDQAIALMIASFATGLWTMSLIYFAMKRNVLLAVLSLAFAVFDGATAFVVLSSIH